MFAPSWITITTLLHSSPSLKQVHTELLHFCSPFFWCQSHNWKLLLVFFFFFKTSSELVMPLCFFAFARFSQALHELHVKIKQLLLTALICCCSALKMMRPDFNHSLSIVHGYFSPGLKTDLDFLERFPSIMTKS